MMGERTEERVGIMADREAADRDTRRTATRLKFAALRQNAYVEDIDLSHRSLPACFPALRNLTLARGDVRHARLPKTLAKTQLLILDD